ncbi:hypothetical protein MKW98_015903 [Papaver atlanticum]|uniref:Uncharacterized protein n=1 Tax=Papaver atlanticum TaxID=357466 RepID=A0AAD4SSJ5_9MAGN|nr:hypothetical protein MKW98_015903 [Papaver atlanticum]
MGQGMPQEKVPANWDPPRPQNFIRELELTNVVEDYPKLREFLNALEYHVLDGGAGTKLIWSFENDKHDIVS